MKVDDAPVTIHWGLPNLAHLGRSGFFRTIPTANASKPIECDLANRPNAPMPATALLSLNPSTEKAV